MEFVNLDDWQQLFGVSPKQVSKAELRHKVSRAIRSLCNELNQQPRRDQFSIGLQRLKDMGRLLEKHQWLAED
jgi:hypothetical protein